MADRIDRLTLADFREMAAAWDRWQEMFSPKGAIAKNEMLGPARTRAFVAVTREEPVWKLAVSAAAYVNVPTVERVSHRPGSLRAIARSLAQNDWVVKYPDFPETVIEVAQSPLDALVRVTPRLSSLLAVHHTLTATAFACIDFCLMQHPTDHDAFVECVRSCQAR